MKSIENLLKEINTDIKNTLSEERYQHSLGVMKRAEELAVRYHIDINKAKIVGLAHDIAKEMPKEEKIKYAKEHHIKIDKIEEKNVELLHGKIGASICKTRYHFTEDMQKAVEYHTLGKEKMDDLAKIILIADKTEYGRTYLDFEKIKKVEQSGINELLIYVLDDSIKNTINKGKIIHPDSIYTRNYFLLE